MHRPLAPDRCRTLRGTTLTESLLVFQMFMSVVAVTGLVLGAVITQRRRAEEALQQSEKRYRELVENATDLVYTLDLTGNVTSLNKAGEQMMGYTRDEALAMNFRTLLRRWWPRHIVRSRRR